MTPETMTMNEIRNAGIDALTKALGPVGMARFMQQFDMGRGDYTKERHLLIKDLSIDEIVKENEESKTAKE